VPPLTASSVPLIDANSLIEKLLSKVPLVLVEQVRETIRGERPDANLALREALRMLYLFSTGHSGAQKSIAPALDEVWHILILETRLYHSLCKRLPSTKYIHHSVSSVGSGVDSALPRADFCRTAEGPSLSAERRLEKSLALLSSYVGLFGPFEEAAVPYWAGLSDLVGAFSLDLPTLNARLAAICASSAMVHA
jgi:hypothetical protein